MRKHIVAVIAVLLWLLAPTPGRAAMGVFVTIAPQKWLAEQVGGNLVTVRVLVPAGQDPHTFEPTPRQVMALAAARLWFTMDMPFENQLVQRVRGASVPLRVVDVTRTIHRLPLAQDEEHEHGEEGLDPHVWLSCANLEKMASAMSTALIAADPGHRAAYERNLAAVTSELRNLDQRIAARLAPYAGATVLVYHPAFGYFTHAYHLRQQPVEIEGKSPSPRQLSRVISQARAAGIRVVFVQPGFDPRSAQVVAKAIGGQVVELDPLAENVPAALQQMAARIAGGMANNGMAK